MPPAPAVRYAIVPGEDSISEIARRFAICTGYEIRHVLDGNRFAEEAYMPIHEGNVRSTWMQRIAFMQVRTVDRTGTPHMNSIRRKTIQIDWRDAVECRPTCEFRAP